MAYGTVNADIIQSSVSGVSLGAGNASIMKNRIINGAFNVNQYNLGTVTPTANQYIIDRWLSNVSTASKFSVAQSSVAPAGFTNSALITSTSAYTVASGDYETFQQRIEANNMFDMGWGTANAKTVTLSFWVQSSLTGTFGGSLYFPASTARTYPFSYTISAANTWQQIAITIPGDTFTNTAPTGTSLYVIVQWALGVGTTYQGTAGSWVSGNYASVTGATNLIATNGATFYITSVQLEVGSSATGFEYRQYTTELNLCQRYYTFIGNETVGTEIPAASNGTVRVRGAYYYPVTMRTAPSASIAGTPSFYTMVGTTPTYSSPANIAGTTTKYATIDLNITGTTLTAGQWANNISFNTTGCYIAWSAEL